MTFIYTQSDLEERINGGIQGKIDILVDKENTMNAAARELFGSVDLRSSARRAVLAPNMFNGIFKYTCPTDLKGYSLIDLPAQAKRSDGEWQLTTPEDFDLINGTKTGIAAIDDYDGLRVLKLASAVDSDSIVVSELDSTTSGGGTWAAFGDAETIAADTDDFIKGSGSIKWNISSAGGTTAGLVNTSVNSVDISDYLGGTSAFFVWVKINSTTNLTNYILRFGSSASAYHSKTVTAQADGTAFVAGWNLLKFNVSSLTDTGTPDDTALVYFALYMTKTAGKVSESDYKFDWLVLKKGVINYVKYYSKYPWTTSGGTYLENSTTSTDLLVADTDEFDLVVKQGVLNARREIGFPLEEIAAAEADLMRALGRYKQMNPSQTELLANSYFNFV